MEIKNKPHDWREARRLQALVLKDKGYKPVKIVEALAVTQGAVSQWLKKERQGGSEALLRHPVPKPGLVPTNWLACQNC